MCNARRVSDLRLWVSTIAVILTVIAGNSASAELPRGGSADFDRNGPDSVFVDVAPEASWGGQVDQLVRMAMLQHPELAAARAGVSREVGLRFQATRKPNPSFGYAAGEAGMEGRAGQQGLYLAQEWVTAGKRDIAGQAGAWRVRAASERLNLARMRLTRRVETQYWNMIAARHRVAILQDLEALLEDAVRINQTLFEAAEVGRGTVLQAKLEQRQVSMAKRQAEIELAAQMSVLAATLGVDADFIVRVPTDPWPEPLPLEQPLATEPWAASPELAEARALTEAARWDLQLAQTEVVANLDSYASLQHDAVTDDVIVGLQIGMAVPIYDRKRGLIRAARAEVARREAEAERLLRSVQSRWAAAKGEYDAAAELVRTVEQELLDLAQERLELARRAHQQGELDYLELLTAQRSFLMILQTTLDAQQQAVVASVRLETWVVED